jgi:hypothetical protein
MKTELVWDGKSDENSNRRPVDVAGSAIRNAEDRDCGYAQELSASRWPDHPWRAEEDAYKDMWGKETDSYLHIGSNTMQLAQRGIRCNNP